MIKLILILTVQEQLLPEGERPLNSSFPYSFSGIATANHCFPFYPIFCYLLL